MGVNLVSPPPTPSLKRRGRFLRRIRVLLARLGILPIPSSEGGRGRVLAPVIVGARTPPPDFLQQAERENWRTQVRTLCLDDGCRPGR
jgi:hypothetical protein